MKVRAEDEEDEEEKEEEGGETHRRPSLSWGRWQGSSEDG